MPEYIPGPEGEPGPPGKSAFDVARAAGFRGTAKQWLESLKGEKGDRGDAGRDGLHGKDGAPGVTALPEFPTGAHFERDDITKLTQRVLVSFPSGTLEIVPIRDDADFMVDAAFYRV